MHAKNFKDLTGMHFGYYDVLEEAPSRIQPNGNIVIMWKCRCVCGKIKIVSSNHLKNRPQISCGCMKKSTLIDLTGQVFNLIKVIDRAPDTTRGTKGKKRVNWNCECLACGKLFILDAYNIKKGVQKSCGCINGYFKSQAKLNDYTNKTVGRLYIESRAEDYVKPSGGTDRRWNCVCECGNRCVKTSEYLRTSPMPSCGCWKKEITSKIKTKNVTGEIFGYLMVLSKVETRYTSGGNSKIVYKCKCLNCGSVKEVTAGSLFSGQTKSCGCIKSYGEEAVILELNKKRIKYKTQFYFKDLFLTSPDHPLLFDFAILDDKKDLKYLIEYQGLQHYKSTDKNGSFGKQQREITDPMKKEYCKAHNIALYEIRYDESIPKAIDHIIATHANFVPSSEISEKV